MSIELTVLGCSGSYASPALGPTSGYLLVAGRSTVWLDCGSGTFERLQRHAAPEDLSAVVITHRHPDHCVDLLGLAMMLRYYRGRETGPPVYAPAEVAGVLGALWAETEHYFPWHEVGDGDKRTLDGDLTLRFSRTDHPVPTVAVEAEAGGTRLVYTSDTGPGWSAAAFGSGPDLLLAEATYQTGHEGPPIHLTAAQAGAMAAEAGARRLVLTHLAPDLDPAVSVAEAEDAFGGPVTLAAPDLRVRI